MSNSSRGSEGRELELLGVTELEELLVFAELEDFSFLTLELDLSDSVELEYSSGSAELVLEESSPQAKRKNRAQKGSNL